MARRKRDYKAEYRRRIRRGIKAGLTPQEARGRHPKEKKAKRIPRRSFAARVLGVRYVGRRRFKGQEIFNLSGRTKATQKQAIAKEISARMRTIKKREGYVTYRYVWKARPGYNKKRRAERTTRRHKRGEVYLEHVDVESTAFFSTERDVEDIAEELTDLVDDRDLLGIYLT